jgi:hypothetical protein
LLGPLLRPATSAHTATSAALFTSLTSQGR